MVNIDKFIRDLKTFSDTELVTLAKYYRLQYPSANFYQKLAEKIIAEHQIKASMPNGLTGIKDTDMEILLNLSDDDLAAACRTNKEVSKICNDDYFWTLRFKKYLGVDPQNIDVRTLYSYIKNFKSPQNDDCEMPYAKLYKPLEYTQLLAVEEYPWNIRYFYNPSEKVKMTAFQGRKQYYMGDLNPLQIHTDLSNDIG